MAEDDRRTTKRLDDLLERAEAAITTYSPAEAIDRHDDDTVVFVDVRDQKELENNGIIPGAVHASRGAIEFYVDPESPYYKEVFSPDEDKEFMFYCAVGLRGALAAHRAQEMGVDRVANVKGGLEEWVNAEGPVEPFPPRQ